LYANLGEKCYDTLYHIGHVFRNDTVTFIEFYIIKVPKILEIIKEFLPIVPMIMENLSTIVIY